MPYVNALGEDLTDYQAALKKKFGESIETISKGIDTKSLPGILKNAEAYADQYLGVNADKAKKKAFEFLYIQACAAASKVMQTEAGKVFNTIASSGMQIGSDVKFIQGKLSSKEPIDAGGAVDMASAGKRIIGTLLGLGQKIGAVDAKTTANIMAWADVAVGCAAAASSLNPYVAAGACAIQVLSQLIDSMGKNDSGPPQNMPRAIFVPDKDQIIIAATDAERLASVLRYKYGITSYKWLYDRLTGYTDVIDFPDGTVNEAEFFYGKYPMLNDPTPLTAIDLRVALVLMRFQGADSPGAEYGVAPSNKKLGNWGVSGDGRNPWLATRHTLSKIADSGEGGIGRDGAYDRSISSMYVYDHDVCVQTIDAGYNWWTQFKNERNAFGLDAFKRVHELINYFTAITKRELALGQKQILGYVPPSMLPVRLYAVTDTGGAGCRYDFYDTDGCVAYGKQCITNIERCGLGTNECSKWRIQLEDSSRSDHECALRQVGALRLMAAFSYMQMVYMKSYESGVALPTRDMIANLPPTTDQALSLNLPVEINYANADGARWPATTNQILGSINSKAKEVAQIKAMAEKASAADQMIVSIASQAVMQAASTKTPILSSGTDAIQQMIKSGQLNLQTFSQARLDCKDDGGEWFEGGAICDVPAGGGSIYNCRAPTSSDSSTSKRYYCVPKGTPGASQISASGQVSTGPGVGAVVAIAGAALLLMRLLKS